MALVMPARSAAMYCASSRCSRSCRRTAPTRRARKRSHFMEIQPERAASRGGDADHLDLAVGRQVGVRLFEHGPRCEPAMMAKVDNQTGLVGRVGREPLLGRRLAVDRRREVDGDDGVVEGTTGRLRVDAEVERWGGCTLLGA